MNYYQQYYPHRTSHWLGSGGMALAGAVSLAAAVAGCSPSVAASPAASWLTGPAVAVRSAPQQAQRASKGNQLP